jgi:multidrug efflux pump subunit AcrB
MIDRLAAHGGFVDLDRSLKLGQPELRVIPDRAKAAALGIDGRTLADAVQIMIGGLKVGRVQGAGRRYDIRARLEPADRSDPRRSSACTCARATGASSSCATWCAPSSAPRRRRSRAISGSAA